MLIQELAINIASSTQEESSSLDQRFGLSQEEEEDFQEDLCRKCQDLFLDKM